MILPYVSSDPVGYAICRRDGKALDLAARTWGPLAAAPTAAQLGKFASVGAPAQQVADIPQIDGTDLADDARLFGCFRFGGSAHHLVASAAACVARLPAFTWAAWLRCDPGNAPNATMIGEGTAASPVPLFQVGLDKTAAVKGCATLRDSSGLTAELTGAITVSDGIWHHVAATYDGSALSLYVDGAPDGTAPFKAGPVGTDRAAFGALVRGSAAFNFTGGLDDVRSYTRCLSADEIRAVARRWLAGTTGLTDCWVAIWTLDAAGAPKTLADVVPLSYLTLGGPMPGGAARS